jgi:hypothetical protein
VSCRSRSTFDGKGNGGDLVRLAREEIDGIRIGLSLETASKLELQAMRLGSSSASLVVRGIGVMACDPSREPRLSPSLRKISRSTKAEPRVPHRVMVVVNETSDTYPMVICES